MQDLNGLVCGPLPLVATLGIVQENGRDIKCFNHQDPKAWPSHSNVTYSFIDAASLLREGLVKDAIAEYTRYANVTLVEQTDEKLKGSAMIRISFKNPNRAWSAIGIDALRILSKETMSLGFIPENIPTTSDAVETRKLLQKLTLHEFGHAFGLAHEWKRTNTLSPRPGDMYEDAIDQHQKAFKFDTSNFPEPDEDSIMNFFVPNSLTSGNAITLKEGLSDKDKAWLTLNYPGKAASAGGDADAGVLKALNVLKVPLTTTSRILLSSTVSEMRFHYLEYISTTHRDQLGAKLITNAIEKLKSENSPHEFSVESHVLQGKMTGVTPLVDHNNEDDLYDTVAAAVLNPQFHQILANVVNQPDDDQPQDAQHFIGPLLGAFTQLAGLLLGGTPKGTASGLYTGTPDAQHFIPLLTSLLPMILGQVLNGIPGGTAATINPQPLPPQVQQGIFDMFSKIVKSPVFTEVVKGAVTSMISDGK